MESESKANFTIGGDDFETVPEQEAVSHITRTNFGQKYAHDYHAGQRIGPGEQKRGSFRRLSLQDSRIIPVTGDFMNNISVLRPFCVTNNSSSQRTSLLHKGTSTLKRFSSFSGSTYFSRGSSTVAIDNKIEQAMDLVKSHLMFAVREEVEVLKEQIAELIERNNQLEYENGILRAAASPETLAKLAQPRQQPPSSSSS